MPTVLVVDDKPSQTDLICIMLRKLDIDCLVAHSGRDGLQSARNNLPDLILMDWIMPADTMTGMDAVKALISDPTTQHIPIIACSAVVDPTQALQAGCTDYIRKPFDFEALRQKLQRHI